MSQLTATPQVDQVVRRWSRGPRCVGRARAELSSTLADWNLVTISDSALLVLSELLTNAVRHARVRGREIETRFVRLAQGVRIEVHDASSVCPVRVAPSEDLFSGRGLLIVDALSGRWGVSDRRGPGKAVWAELHAQAVIA
ncbi:ATP-binding protein [Streptomyces sp. MUM 203J]|uniref:ATP-binding protein n=1 Tax=Streptomyces sp. MUM 203J TaxID=2791990 RepID=UPI001F04A990|nr:ATP-binding protein [Streptomyces sp. MUM 203J]MCH0539091.1 ATP-binding protein [Streptomyces sp. MUM 203J]